ncbi:hypothetical protein EK21DRAFT_108383 [Setomelanomma holmii]|uniref:Uncharacterized protein n=1 Tax=Setomelanomma holmii TaxID=210430 RepID=A0A9P4HIR5_9PLEO|nr:hypothetical protein EK21DRAFT_108383 [Setomelanomma holmii]
MDSPALLISLVYILAANAAPTPPQPSPADPDVRSSWSKEAIVGLTSVFVAVTGILVTLMVSKKLRKCLRHFWPQYRDWVEEQADADATQQVRPARELELIAKAELYWDAKVLEQQQAKAANHAALVRLFRSMPRLDNLQIMEWTCARELREHGIDWTIDAEVECQFADTEILNQHIATLGRALGEAGTSIRHLLLPTVYGRSIMRSPAANYLFSTLTSLSFDLHDPAEMLGDYDEQPPSFRTLIQCARHTLENLEFSNLFAYRLEYSRRGEHLLEKLWGHEPGTANEAFVFPRLRKLKLVSFILYTPSLIMFLQSQPVLEEVTFRHIYLPTQGYGWPEVAAALPSSCQSFHMDSCGGQSTARAHPDPPPDSNIEQSQIEPFNPYNHQFPKSCGWRVRKSCLEREAEKYIVEHYKPYKDRIAEQIGSAQSGGEKYMGAPLGELLEQEVELDRAMAAKVREFKERIESQNHADYERCS